MAAKYDDFVSVRRGNWYYGDLPADHGAVFALRGYPKDDRLVELGLLEKLPRRPTDLAQCGVCGMYFLSGVLRDAHGDLRHRPEPEPIVAGPLSPMEGFSSYSMTGIEGAMVPDLTGDAEERRAEREAPIYWEKTKASLKG